MTADLFDLDLYAGAGGWDEGGAILGHRSVGLEIEHDPCVTARRAGHVRIRCDVATYPTAPFRGRVRRVKGSPPCQAWSMAGNRLGEEDRARVHELVDEYAAGADQPGDGWADPRSHHAAQPVRWIRDLRPESVCLEQVPPVLGLWEHIARVLRGWGYSTWVGVLNSADYGVPQTRKRAILIASRVRAATPPEPTHAREPVADLFGVRARWVSMAEALGWPGVDRPARTVCGNREPRWAYGQGGSYATGWTLDRRTNSRGPQDTVAPVVLDRPAPTLTSMSGRQWVLRSSHAAKVNDRTQPRSMEEPAQTINFGHSSMEWVVDEQDTLRISVVEAAILQSFPAGYPWHGNKTSTFLQVGNAIPPRLAAAVLGAAAGVDWQTAVDAYYGGTEAAA
jgi:DNA (cytosine-5)-methyltransferase 1